jgi:hypothetical protein
MWSDAMSFLTEIANKIELHLKLDESPGYHLSTEDQEAIIEALRFTDLKSETCPACGDVRIATAPPRT